MDRKKLAYVLLFITLVLFGCKKKENTYTEGTQMKNITYWFDHSSVKTRPGSKAGELSSYKAYLAKNEYETVQFVLLTDVNEDNLTLEITRFSDSKGNTMEAEILQLYYIETRRGEFYPDPAVPLTGGFSLEANKNQPFLIKIKSTKTTPEGEYSAALTLCANGELVFETKIQAKVWDFSLPDTPSCATYMLINEDSIAKAHGIVLESQIPPLFGKYYDFLLDNKISTQTLPYDLLSPAADSYLKNPQMTSFGVPYGGGDELIGRLYEKLSSIPEAFNKGVFYVLDEPTEKHQYDEISAGFDRLDSLYPGGRILTPFFRNIKINDTDNIGYMTGKIKVWCPKTYMFDNKDIYQGGAAISDPPFEERMAERKAAGDCLWWYVCWEPGEPFLNLYVDMPGIMHRLLFWQQKLYGVDGFLYWCVNYWPQVDDPWEDMRTVKNLSPDVFGDGSLLYNGSKVGINGPVGSLRIENIREGIDDFEYLCIAEKLFGIEFAENYIKRLTENLTHYTTDDNKLIDTRIELGNEIEKASRLLN